MKQRTIITVLALVALALSATPALAQDNTDATTNTGTKPAPVRVLMQLKDKVEEKRVNLMERKASTTERMLEKKANVENRIASSTERKVERKAEINARKASSTERRIDRQQDIAKRQAEHTGKVFTATIERLEKILARLESRIEKLKSGGVDTSVSEGFVVEAKAHLSLARQSIEAFSSVDLSADKAKENFQRVRSLAMEVKTHLKAAHQSLMKAIRALKGPNSAERKTGATSTSEGE